MDNELPQLPAPTWKDKIDNARTTLQAKVESARATIKRSPSQLNESLRSRTALWTGIAAAGGLGAGLLGRFAMNRGRESRQMPAVVIIEASC